MLFVFAVGYRYTETRSQPINVRFHHEFIHPSSP